MKRLICISDYVDVMSGLHVKKGETVLVREQRTYSNLAKSMYFAEPDVKLPALVEETPDINTFSKSEIRTLLDERNIKYDARQGRDKLLELYKCYVY